MKMWTGDNWSEEDSALVTAYRSWRNRKKINAETADALGQRDTKRALQLLRQYDAVARKRCRLRHKKKMDAAAAAVTAATSQVAKLPQPCRAGAPPRLYRARPLVGWGHKELRIVDPPTGTEQQGFVKLLASFAEFLDTQYSTWCPMFKEVQNIPEQHPCSVRIIDGDRLEFMLSGVKGYSGFLQLIECMNSTDGYGVGDPGEFRLNMITYAHQQMQEDGRTSGLKIFQDEGLIISRKGTSAAQNPHMDLQDGRNVQGGLLITGGDHIKATYEYEPTGTVVYDLTSFLCLYSDMPTGLSAVLGTNPEEDSVRGAAAKEVSVLLLDFGRLLSEGLLQISCQPDRTDDSPLQTGAMFTLPGNVIHAGPSTTGGVRAILFLAATDHTTGKYNPDLQYNRTNMWVSIAAHVWQLFRSEHDQVEGRLYLLSKIKGSAEDLIASSRTINHKHFKKFTEQVEKAHPDGVNKAGNQVQKGRRSTLKTRMKEMAEEVLSEGAWQKKWGTTSNS
jgi:hypothetical protein